MKSWWYLTISLVFLWASQLSAREIAKDSYQLSSPDAQLTVQIEIGKELEWSLWQQDLMLIEPSAVSLTLNDGEVLGYEPKVIAADRRSIDTTFATPFYTQASVKDRYEEIVLEFEGQYGLIFRLYNDAMAYRFFTKREASLVIRNELASFHFPDDPSVIVPYANDFRGGVELVNSFEAYYETSPLSQFKKGEYAMLPMMVIPEEGPKMVLLEADLQDYPGMYLQRNTANASLEGSFPRYPTAFEQGGYRNMNTLPTTRAEEIARTRGDRNYPWRVLVVVKSDKDLLDNAITLKLASPSRVKDTSWIRPGQSTWDWWNDWMLKGVPFQAGQNNETYRFHIDFAHQFGIPYITIDWGWTDILDLTSLNPEVDLESIVAYGKSKGVGVIVWASWKAVVDAGQPIFEKFQKLGVSGMKIDFIDRDDQIAVRSLWEIAALAAEHELLINFHGMYKPSGFQRTYPNVINYEGVKGLENEKWADVDSPRNDLTIPYLRNLSGPMDYTPGAMRNVIQSRFASINDAPMSKGTRCHQAAMYVAYYAPLQMLADSPSYYLAEPEYTSFVTSLPTVYDESIPLDGTIGESLLIARRRGENWYIAAMTNWDKREFEVSLGFLGTGKWQAEVLSDGINAHKEGTDYTLTKQTVGAGDTLALSLAPGGGWVAIISPME